MGDEVRSNKAGQPQVRRARSEALTASKRQMFLDTLSATANVRCAAAAAGATQGSFYRLRQRDGGFAAAWAQSLADGYAALEALLLSTAMGTDDAGAAARPVQPAGDPDRAAAAPFDPQLALALLKRRDAATPGSNRSGNVAGYAFVPMAEVERSLLAKLDALARRLGIAPAAAGPETPAATR